MEYELTRYGEEYLETLPRRVDEKAEKAKSRGIGVSRVSGWYPLMRRQAILSSIRRGEEPVPNFSDEMLKRYPSKTKATQGAFSKELQSMLKDNLVRESKPETQNVIYRLGDLRTQKQLEDLKGMRGANRGLPRQEDVSMEGFEDLVPVSYCVVESSTQKGKYAVLEDNKLVLDSLPTRLIATEMASQLRSGSSVEEVTRPVDYREGT